MTPHSHCFFSFGPLLGQLQSTVCSGELLHKCRCAVVSHSGAWPVPAWKWNFRLGLHSRTAHTVQFVLGTVEEEAEGMGFGRRLREFARGQGLSPPPAPQIPVTRMRE